VFWPLCQFYSSTGVRARTHTFQTLISRTGYASPKLTHTYRSMEVKLREFSTSPYRYGHFTHELIKTYWSGYKVTHILDLGFTLRPLIIPYRAGGDKAPHVSNLRTWCWWIVNFEPSWLKVTWFIPRNRGPGRLYTHWWRRGKSKQQQNFLHLDRQFLSPPRKEPSLAARSEA
jgi:hypothetical protein